MAEVKEKGQQPERVEQQQEEYSSRAERALERNKTPLIVVGVIILLVLAGLFFFQLYKQNKSIEAQRELYPAIFYFEQDSLNLALNGDGNRTFGFLQIADEFGVTEAGNLANFYAGAALLKQREYNNAIDYLKEFDANDFLIQARAYALTGDAYMELADYANAATSYNKAATINENEFFTPDYLMKLGLAQERAGNFSAALEAYETIVEEYTTSDQYTLALKYAGKLAAMQE